MSAALREAFTACETIVRLRARNFWYGLRLLPEPRRSAMYAIYAWMREADDLADEPGVAVEERRERLRRFREATERALAGDAPDARPVWLALADVAPRYRLDATDFRDMLAGQETDLEPVALRTWEELRLQCYRVASTVGLVCIRVWGAGERGRVDPIAREQAIARGIAFQLTNILRDVAEDRELGRVYLPADELAEHGLDVDALLAWRDPGACAAFFARQVDRARQHYRAGEGLEERIAPECVPTSWALDAIYRRLLERVARDPRAALRARRRLPAWEKILIGLKARWLVRASGARRQPEVATP